MPHASWILVGLKSDLRENAILRHEWVSEEEGVALAAEKGAASFHLVSSLDNVGLHPLMHDAVATSLLNRNLDSTKDHVTKARRVMRGMNRRIVTNKLIAALIILLLLGLIGTVLYFSFVNK